MDEGATTPAEWIEVPVPAPKRARQVGRIPMRTRRAARRKPVVLVLLFRPMRLAVVEMSIPLPSGGRRATVIVLAMRSLANMLEVKFGKLNVSCLLAFSRCYRLDIDMELWEAEIQRNAGRPKCGRRHIGSVMLAGSCEGSLPRSKSANSIVSIDRANAV